MCVCVGRGEEEVGMRGGNGGSRDGGGRRRAEVEMKGERKEKRGRYEEGG